MKNNVLILTEGINVGGQQLMIVNLIKNNNTDVSYYLGYLFKGSDELSEPLKDIFESLTWFKFPSRRMKDLFLHPMLLVKSIRSIIRFINEQKISVIISNGFYSFFCASIVKIFRPKTLHIRFVGGDLNRNESFHLNSKLYYILPLYRFTDKIVSWEYMLDVLREKGIDHSKLEYDIDLLSLVDTKMFYPQEKDTTKQLRDELGIMKTDIVIGWVGRLAPDKEIMNTLKLIEFLKLQGHNNIKFLIVGDGVAKDDIFAELKSKNINSLSIYVGYRPQNDLNRYYNIIDFEVLLDEDPMGGSHIREAMACGRIAITTNGTSKTQEKLIVNKISGILVSPNNMLEEAYEAIVWLSKDKDSFDKISKQARTDSLRYRSYRHAMFKINKLIESGTAARI